jgi:type IV secretion system protein VirB2
MHTELKRFLIAMTALVAMAHAEPVFAQSFVTAQSTADVILNFLTGAFARTIAAIAFCAVGIAGFLGRINWAWAGSIMVSLVLIFGGASFVDTVEQAAS